MKAFRSFPKRIRKVTSPKMKLLQAASTTMATMKVTPCARRCQQKNSMELLACFLKNAYHQNDPNITNKCLNMFPMIFLLTNPPRNGFMDAQPVVLAWAMAHGPWALRPWLMERLSNRSMAGRLNKIAEIKRNKQRKRAIFSFLLHFQASFMEHIVK